jgi:hypothetical protein
MVHYWQTLLDWMNSLLLAKSFTPILDLIKALSVIVASVVAIYGINTWRRELRGKKEYELAEEVLSLFYRARDIIRAMRSPFAIGGEGSTRKPQDKETAKEKEVRDRAYIVMERFQREKETFDRLHALRFRFMALFGNDKEQPFRDLYGVVHKIFVASHMLAFDWQREEFIGVAQHELGERRKRIRENEEIFWQQPDNDPIEKRVEEIIGQVEAQCKAIIQPERTRWWRRKR